MDEKMTIVECEEKPESKTKRKQLSPAAEELFKGFIEDKQERPRK